MDNSANGAPDDELEPLRRINHEREPAQDRVGPGRAQPAGEGRDRVERQLAQYGFTREERDHEVRLLVRDTAADELAISFRAAGATFITLTGERALDPYAATAAPPHSLEEDRGHQHIHRHRRGAAALPSGELTMRYFYALGDTVYTISITTA